MCTTVSCFVLIVVYHCRTHQLGRQLRKAVPQLGLPGEILARNTTMLDGRQQNPDNHLQQAAKDFDAQFGKLSSLLNGSDDDLAADRMVAEQVLGSIAESCRQIKEHLDGIEAGQMGPPSSRQLLASLKRMCGLERGAPITPTTSVNGTPRSRSYGTPSSINRPTKKERIATTPVRYLYNKAYMY